MDLSSLVVGDLIAVTDGTGNRKAIFMGYKSSNSFLLVRKFDRVRFRWKKTITAVPPANVTHLKCALGQLPAPPDIPLPKKNGGASYICPDCGGRVIACATLRPKPKWTGMVCLNCQANFTDTGGMLVENENGGIQ